MTVNPHAGRVIDVRFLIDYVQPLIQYMHFGVGHNE